MNAELLNRLKKAGIKSGYFKVSNVKITAGCTCDKEGEDFDLHDDKCGLHRVVSGEKIRIGDPGSYQLITIETPIGPVKFADHFLEIKPQQLIEN